jgi:hypothetical protein
VVVVWCGQSEKIGVAIQPSNPKNSIVASVVAIVSLSFVVVVC